MRSIGEWNAYVAGGIDRAEREERLSEVPSAMRGEVLSHARTVYAIRQRAEKKQALSFKERISSHHV